MADVQQSAGDGATQVAAARARFDKAVAFAEWVNQAPPSSEPQTAAMTFSEVLGDILGELARIMSCYMLKQATDMYHDSAMQNGNLDDALYKQGKAKADELAKLNKCPPLT